MFPHSRKALAYALALSGLYLLPPAAAQQPQYTGPGSCSSSACHGGIQPKLDTNIQQNEYSTWIVQDKHAKAFEVLGNAQSQRIARNLGLKNRADAESRCLACHALAVPAEKRARTFDLSEGVSCESCHGPASAWLGPHTSRGWTHERSVQLGMYDTKDLGKRTEKCLSCHLGTADASLDHELIAAGHPDLIFELEAFSAVMPRHWRQRADKDPYAGVREWGMGQVVQLRAALQQLSRRARSGPWPEYAEMDCFACHHSLTSSNDSWRQSLGYADRRPGVAAWNTSRYAVLKLLATDTDADSARALSAELEQVVRAMNRLAPERQEVAAAADRAAAAAERIQARLAARRFDDQARTRLLRSIVADADAISLQGERAAEQAAMAVNALLLAGGSSLNQAESRAALDALFRQLDSPSSYNPRRFAEQLKKIGTLVP